MINKLMGISEIAQRIGVSRQRADQLARQKGFPNEVADLRCGRIWLTDDVEHWIQIYRPANVQPI